MNHALNDSRATLGFSPHGGWPLRIIENDKTTSAITMSDGDVVTLPTTLLHADEAMILRQYRDWLDARRIHRSFHCKHCRVPDPITAERTLPKSMDVFITDSQILFSCDHQRLFFQGSTPSRPFRFETDPPLPEGFVLSGGPLRMALLEPERELLRAVKLIRRKYDLLESNLCMDCFEHGGYDPRMAGGIDDRNGKIAWFCSHRAFIAPPSIC